MTAQSTSSVVAFYAAVSLLTLLPALTFQPAIAQSTCLDPASDPDGDGWGFENGESCMVEAGTAGVSNPAINNTAGGNACIDDDGDGWGWNGVASCLVTPTATLGTTGTTTTSTTVIPLASGTQTCVDTDGDGWGWNGVASCRVTAEPAVTVQSVPAQEVATQAVTAPATVIEPIPVSPARTTSCASVLSAGANLYNAVASTTGRICLRSGNYSLPDNLSLRSNQTLIALDPSNPPVINTSANRTITTTGQNNVSIDSVIIDGNSSGAREFAVLIGNGSNNITLNNVTIRNTFGIGVGITNSSNVTIRGGTITNIGLDVRLRQAIWTTTNSRNITIDGLNVIGRANDQAGGDHAITCIDAVNGFTVTNTRSQYAGSGAVAINNCSNIVVTNNELHDGREHGVDIVNGSINATVRGNNITGMDRSAMVFDDHDWQCAACGTNPTEITVSNNRMSGNNRINLARCRGIAVDSQMIVNPTQQQLQRDWIRITADNQVDNDSALHCVHIN